MIRHMVMGLTNMLMVQLMLVNGMKINSMAKELRNGLMVPSMKVNTSKE